MKDNKTIKFMGYEIENDGESISISQGDDYVVCFSRGQIGLLACQLFAMADSSESGADFVADVMEMAIESICDANASLIDEMGKIESLDLAVEKIGLALVNLRNCLEQIKKGG